jgi:hypothetical protein
MTELLKDMDELQNFITKMYTHTTRPIQSYFKKQ